MPSPPIGDVFASQSPSYSQPPHQNAGAAAAAAYSSSFAGEYNNSSNGSGGNSGGGIGTGGLQVMAPHRSEQIVNLNVGGERFSTTRTTLSWIPDTFFTSLLSGRIASVEDASGAVFIDRDPELFRRILNYLRTKQVDLGNNISISMLRHEAEFYGIGPLVKRLTLCEEMDTSCPCGDVLFHAYIPPPLPPAPLHSISCGGSSSSGTGPLRLLPSDRRNNAATNSEVDQSGNVESGPGVGEGLLMKKGGEGAAVLSSPPSKPFPGHLTTVATPSSKPSNSAAASPATTGQASVPQNARVAPFSPLVGNSEGGGFTPTTSPYAYGGGYSSMATPTAASQPPQAMTAAKYSPPLGVGGGWSSTMGVSTQYAHPQPPYSNQGSPFRTHNKKGSTDLTKQIRSDLSALLRQSEHSEALAESLRVRLIRAHHNSVAVAYYNFVCCYRMRETLGWQLVYASPRMQHPIGHLAIVSKFGQVSSQMLAVSLSDNSIHLWSLDDTGVGAAGGGGDGGGGGGVETHRKLGTFALPVHIDKLFFIGNQLVALSRRGKVGIWHSMTQNWQVQDVMRSHGVDSSQQQQSAESSSSSASSKSQSDSESSRSSTASRITCHDTAGSVLLLGCKNGSIYYFDMQKFPLRMKDNDLLITELYRDPNQDEITAISVYLTPKTNLCGNWIEIAYGTNTGCVRVIVQHPETVGHGPQLFQTFTVHTAPITRVALTTSHLISVCNEYNHVRTWSVTRFRGMISTQPGGTSLASFKVMTLDPADDTSDELINASEGCDAGPYGEQDGEQLFVQRLVPDTNVVFVRLASNGERLCTVRSVDGSGITAFHVYECEGSNRMGARPRRYLFTGTLNGSVQMWDLTAALDQHQQTRAQLIQLALGGALVGGGGTTPGGGGGGSADRSTTGSNSGGAGGSASFSSLVTALNLQSLNNFLVNRQLLASLQGPTPEELLQLIDQCELCTASLNSTPALTPHQSALNLSGITAHNNNAACGNNGSRRGSDFLYLVNNGSGGSSSSNCRNNDNGNSSNSSSSCGHGNGLGGGGGSGNGCNRGRNGGGR